MKTYNVDNHLDIKDIQKILKLSRSSAYNLVNSGQFPVVKIGNLIRIPETEFSSWLQTQQAKQAKQGNDSLDRSPNQSN